MIKFKHNPTVNNRITYRFGLTPEYGPKFHNGIDLGAVNQGIEGDSIFAVDDGVVILTKEDSSTAGNYIILGHQNYFSRYLHLKEIKVHVGQNIKAGDIVGLMGSTGSSTAAHLHLEIKAGDYKDFWKKDEKGKYILAVNPEFMLVNDVHWAEKHFNNLIKNGIKINDKRFDDAMTRGEVFALLDRVLEKVCQDY